MLICRCLAHVSALTVVGLGLFATPAAAQVGVAEIPRSTDGRPDLNGIWQALNTANWDLEAHAAAQGAVESLGAIGAVAPGVGVVESGQIPYLPAAAIQQQENFGKRRTDDPEAKCFLPGVPRATYLPHPFQILQTDSDILMAYQYAGAVRTIFMQDQIDAPVDSWMGWSNGRWEDDTLVVEVSGQNGQAWLDRVGNFASASLRVVERYTPLGANHIQYEATLEDPSVYSGPWTISMPLYRRMEPSVRLMEFKCVQFSERMMYEHLDKPGSGSTDSGDSNE